MSQDIQAFLLTYNTRKPSLKVFLDSSQQQSRTSRVQIRSSSIEGCQSTATLYCDWTKAINLSLTIR